jgi:ubiquinone/menaquinone biosynthesis C-methylase UbiE
MSDFEKQYYEEEGFWQDEMLHEEENKERIVYTASLVPEGAASLADIGCGNGIFVNYLQRERPELKLIGVDRSNAALKHVKTNKLAGDVAAIPLETNSYDCVACLEVIEHLPSGVFEKALSELARVAKDHIIISVPYKEDLEERHNQCPSCKTIFNHDLHLRSFSDQRMQELLEPYGFSCVSTRHLGKSVRYRGHTMFRRLLYKEQFKTWRSPICPFCGYVEARKEGQAPKANPLAAPPATGFKSKVMPLLTGLPKLLWPKEKRYYWIVALYKRNN